MTKTDDGEVGVTATSGGRVLNLATTKIGTKSTAIEFHQVDTPPLFCGMRQNWMEGSHDDGDLTYSLDVGAGMGSRWMTLTIRHESSDKTIYEVIDMRAMFEAWVRSRLDVLQSQGVSSK